MTDATFYRCDVCDELVRLSPIVSGATIERTLCPIHAIERHEAAAELAALAKEQEKK